MPNNLFNRYGQTGYQPQSIGNNIIQQQLAQLKQNPGFILDIMLQNRKINYQQYNELQQYRNNPEMIVKYLMNNGKSNEIKQASDTAHQVNSNSNL